MIRSALEIGTILTIIPIHVEVIMSKQIRIVKQGTKRTPKDDGTNPTNPVTGKKMNF